MLNEAVIRVLCACFSARIKQKRSLAFASDLGALEGTRTPDLLIRSQTLYPAELPAHMRSYQPQVIYYHSLMKNASVFFILFLNMRNYLSSQY